MGQNFCDGKLAIVESLYQKKEELDQYNHWIV